MSIYRLHFKWKEKEYTLKAKSLDMTHPYFVSIKGLIFPKGKKLIIDPSDDELRRQFGKSEHIMLPFQTVSLIEEFEEDPDETDEAKVMQFPTIEEKKDDSRSHDS